MIASPQTRTLHAAVQLAAAWVTLFVVGTDLFVVSPLMPLIAIDFQVSAGTAGLPVTVFALGYVVAAPVFGHIADRAGRRYVLVRCLTVFAFANGLTAAAHGFVFMTVVRLLCGIAAAGVTPSIYALAGAAAPPGRRATWISIVLTGLLTSLPLGASLGALAGQAMGWHSVFLCLALSSLALVPAHRMLWPEGRGSPGAPAAGFDRASAIGLARCLAPTVAWSTALYSLYTWLGSGLTGMGYDAGTIARIVCLYGAAAFAGALLGGRLADRLGSGLTIQISLIGLCAACLVLRFALSRGGMVEAAFCLVSLLAQMFFPSQQSSLVAAFPDRSATALAWNNSALFLGILLGSAIGGVVMTAGGFTAIMPVSACFAMTGWVLWRRTRIPRAMNRALSAQAAASPGDTGVFPAAVGYRMGAAGGEAGHAPLP